MSTKKDIINELYTAALIMAGAMAVSYLSKKLTKDALGMPATLNGAAKLTVAIGASAVGVKMLRNKKYLPEKIDE